MESRWQKRLPSTRREPGAPPTSTPTPTPIDCTGATDRKHRAESSLRFGRAQGIASTAESPTGEYADRSQPCSLDPNVVQNRYPGVDRVARPDRRSAFFVARCLLTLMYGHIRVGCLLRLSDARNCVVNLNTVLLRRHGHFSVHVGHVVARPGLRQRTHGDAVHAHPHATRGVHL